MASISSILGNNAKNSALKKVTYVTQMIHYTRFENSEKQFYDFGPGKAEALADNIELAGAIHQPVIARQIDAEKYEILSGHKRIAATKILVEDRGKANMAFVPTHVIKVDDYMAEYLLISTNDYPEKTDYERMMEVVRLYEILPHIKADQTLSARALRKLVAKEAAICETRAGNFTNIYRHFTPEAMAAFKAEKFGINVAIKLASLPADEQNMLVKKDSLSITSMESYIQAKKEKESTYTAVLNTNAQDSTPELSSTACNSGSDSSVENASKKTGTDLTDDDIFGADFLDPLPTDNFSEDASMPDFMENELNFEMTEDNSCSENGSIAEANDRLRRLEYAREMLRDAEVKKMHAKDTEAAAKAQILRDALTLYIEKIG